MRIWDVALKTCQKRWTIGRSGERGPGISVLMVRHYYYYYYYYSCKCLVPYLMCCFHWSLSESKFPLVFKILLDILADFNSAVVLVVSTLPLIYSFSCFFYRLFGPVPRAPTKIDINVTLAFSNFFQLVGKIQASVHLFAFFFHSMVRWNGKISTLKSSSLNKICPSC